MVCKCNIPPLHNNVNSIEYPLHTCMYVLASLLIMAMGLVSAPIAHQYPGAACPLYLFYSSVIARCAIPYADAQYQPVSRYGRLGKLQVQAHARRSLLTGYHPEKKVAGCGNWCRGISGA